MLRDGTFMWAGGVGATSGFGGNEATPAGMAEDHISRPSSSVGNSSNKSANRDQVVNDQVVDSPKKKIEDYIKTMCEAVVARSSRSRTREQEEVDELMVMLEQDGVDEGTELYFKALDLFRDSVCRREYKQMKSARNRVAWIEWTWTDGKNGKK